MDVDYSAYEGREITGKVETVMSKGKIIIENGRVPRRQGRRSVPPPRYQHDAAIGRYSVSS